MKKSQVRLFIDSIFLNQRLIIRTSYYAIDKFYMYIFHKPITNNQLNQLKGIPHVVNVRQKDMYNTIITFNCNPTFILLEAKHKEKNGICFDAVKTIICKDLCKSDALSIDTKQQIEDRVKEIKTLNDLINFVSCFNYPYPNPNAVANYILNLIILY